MMDVGTTIRPVETATPATEPVTIQDARKQVEVASGDTTHDADLLKCMATAREQWEADTSQALIQRSMLWTLPELSELQFPHRPVTAIASISYYDTANVQQTLPTSVYQLDTANNRIRLAYEQVWPSWANRWDAVAISYTLGLHTNSLTVPALDKRAILLLVGYYFENRGDFDRPNDMRAYEALVRRKIRSTYP